MKKKAKKVSEAADIDGIFIGELCRIVNRKRNTIYKWEHEGRLPKRLHAKRSDRNWRYWTREQVYGRNGIIAWMKANDIRPGSFITDPGKEAQHITSLRRPKFITKHHVNRVLGYIERGWGAKKIAQKILPDTRYKRWQNVDRALRSYFKAEGWPYPHEDEDEVAVEKLIQKFGYNVSKGDDKRAIKLIIPTR